MAATYPNLLAAGLTAQDEFTPFHLYAGESDIVSDRATAAADIDQFEIVALTETGELIPWDPAAGAATGTLTFSGVGTQDDTITIGGGVITLRNAAASANQVTIGASATATAQAVKAEINANPDRYSVRASGDAAVLTLTALQPGLAGNTIATTESGTATAFGAATLTGGSAESDSKPAGIAAQAATTGEGVPYFTGGQFNHEALVWPAVIDTLAKRKLAFVGTNIGVAKLL